MCLGCISSLGGNALKKKTSNKITYLADMIDKICKTIHKSTIDALQIAGGVVNQFDAKEKKVQKLPGTACKILIG